MSVPADIHWAGVMELCLLLTSFSFLLLIQWYRSSP